MKKHLWTLIYTDTDRVRAASFNITGVNSSFIPVFFTRRDAVTFYKKSFKEVETTLKITKITLLETK